MRRFELSDDRSAKFWSIELAGSSFTVRYGRIGTDGREQLKSFESEATAEKEADKLIKSKVKKGYAEVGAGTVPAAHGSEGEVGEGLGPASAGTGSAPTASSSPSVPPVETETEAGTQTVHDYATTTIEWTDELRGLVLPFRGEGSASKKRAIKPEALFKDVAPRVKKAKKWWQDGAAFATERAGELGAKAFERITRGDEPESFDPWLEAATAVSAFLQAPYDKKGRLATRMVEYWIQRWGLADAARALTHTASVRARMTHPDDTKKYAYRLELLDENPDLGGHASHFQSLDAWLALRRHLATADDATYAEVRDFLKNWSKAQTESKVRSQAMWKVGAALALPDEKSLWEAILKGPAADRQQAFTLALLSCVKTEADARRVLANMPGRRGWTAPYLLTLAHSLRLDALPFLETITPGDHADADYRKAWARAMSVFVGDAPARAVASQLATKSVRGVIGRYFERHPELAIRVLPEVIKGQRNKAFREAASAILETAQHAAEASDAEGEPSGPVSGDDALPEVLRDPPWRRKGKKKKPIVLDLAVADVPAELSWSDSRRKRFEKTADRYRKMERHRDHYEKKNEAALAGKGTGYLRNLVQVESDEDVRRYLEGIEAWGSANEMHVGLILARVGLEVAGPLVRAATTHDIECVDSLAVLGSPHVARPMALAYGRRKLRPIARTWLSRFPKHAAIGLVPHALGSDKKLRKGAEMALRFLLSAGHGDEIRAAAADYGDDAAAAIGAFVDTPPLLDVPPKAPKRPDWTDVTRLPRVQLTVGSLIPHEATEYLVEMLIFSPPDPGYAGLADVETACTNESLDEFAQALCTGWVANGAKSAWSWAVYALGHLGSDASARWLAKRVDGWAAEGSKPKGLLGLETLGQIGTDVALMHVGRWSRSGRRQWLKTGAAAVLAEVAAARGLTPDELEDRTAPDLGLDARGTRILDYGSRKFTVGFDEHLSPFILDAEGERLRAIPPIRKDDDQAAAKDAKKTWATLKKDAEKVSTGQIERLERAMTMRRHWSRDDFTTFILGHPLIGHLAERLLFGVFEDSGLNATFRVAEDRTLANASDDPFELAEGATVGAVHPLELDEATLRRWGEVFGDYEILQPFAQLSRQVHRPTAKEKKSRELERVDEIEAYTGRLFALRKRGWRLDGDPYWLDSAAKELGDGHQAVLVWDEGIDMQQPEMKEHQLRSVRLSGEGSTFGDLDPVLFSELVNDIESLRG